MKPMPTQPSQVTEKIKKNVLLHAQVRKKREAPRSATPSIELYQAENCPFSHAVRTQLSELGLDFVAHAVPANNPFKHLQLVQASGRDRIPFLIDHHTGVKLHESGAILKYLDREYGPPVTSFMTQMARDLERTLRLSAEKISWRMKMPVERSQRLQKEAREGLETVLGGFRHLRETVRRTLRKAG